MHLKPKCYKHTCGSSPYWRGSDRTVQYIASIVFGLASSDSVWCHGQGESDYWFRVQHQNQYFFQCQTYYLSSLKTLCCCAVNYQISAIYYKSRLKLSKLGLLIHLSSWFVTVARNPTPEWHNPLIMAILATVSSIHFGTFLVAENIFSAEVTLYLRTCLAL